MKIIKGILVFATITVGILFSSTAINPEEADKDITTLMAIETANAEWVFFGCAQGGTACGGNINCKSVIISSNKCSPNPYPEEEFEPMF